MDHAQRWDFEKRKKRREMAEITNLNRNSCIPGVPKSPTYLDITVRRKADVLFVAIDFSQKFQGFTLRGEIVAESVGETAESDAKLKLIDLIHEKSLVEIFKHLTGLINEKIRKM